MNLKEEKKVLWASIIVLILALISFIFDDKIVILFSLIRNYFFDNFFIGVSFFSSKEFIFVFLTILFLVKKKNWKLVLPLWFTLGISAVTAFLIKILVNRKRPYEIGIVSVVEGFSEHAHLVWDFSFPSFQAMLGFCVFPIISKKFPKFKYVWLVLAILMALSRVYFGAHYLSDVLIGSLIGYLIGVLILKIEDKRKIFEKLYKRILK